MKGSKHSIFAIFFAFSLLSGCGRSDGGGNYDDDGYKILGTLAGRKLTAFYKRTKSVHGQI